MPFIGIKLIDLVLVGLRLDLRRISMFKELRSAIVMFVVLTVVTGVAYPLLVTGIAQVVFPHQANGSLIVQRRQSRRLGADRPAVSTIRKYFWGRPSATGRRLQRRRHRPAAISDRPIRRCSTP